MNRTTVLALLPWFVLPALAACTWSSGVSGAAADIHIERDRELVVTDDAVLASVSSNAAGEPLSFRHAFASLAFAPAEGGAYAWMRAWSDQLRAEGSADRAAALDLQVTCPWLQATPANHCAADCSTCAATDLSLSSAPFRLLAVANRTDLSVMPDAAGGGEARLVFALTRGPGDDPTSTTEPFTVIVEYRQVGAALDWANRWHALAGVSDAVFPTSLVSVVGPLVDAGALGQVRTADALTGDLLLHEFHLQAGALVATTTRNTPDWSKLSQADLTTFATLNADALTAGTYVLPEPWLAMRSASTDQAPSFVGDVSQHDALLQGTCAGCHALSDSGFQIDPRAQGAAKLSRFLVDPTKALDEIGRRTEWTQLELAQAR